MPSEIPRGDACSFARAMAAGRCGRFADGMDVTRPAASQHLRGLKVRRARRGADRGRPASPVRRWLDRFWDEALDAFKKAAEKAATERKGR
jgi:hypothetical protein